MSSEEAADLPTAAGTSSPASTITVSYRFGPTVTDEGQVIRGGVFVPLHGRDNEPLGTLAVFWRRGGWEPTPDDVETLEQLARSAAGPIENARRYHEARELAETDALTGLHNQRYFHDALGKEVLRAQRYDRQLALIVLDIDDFKGINDSMGHLAGDAVLAQVAERLRETVRTVDVGCRIGGDEFAVILPESRSGDSEQLFDRLRQLLSDTSFGPAGRGLRISGGVAELRPGDSAAALFHRADAALLRAKELGKDRVESDTCRRRQRAEAARLGSRPVNRCSRLSLRESTGSAHADPFHARSLKASASRPRRRDIQHLVQGG